MKVVQKIREQMSSMPQSVGPDVSINEALGVMTREGVRHLPVVDGQELLGLVTERSLKVASSYEGSDSMVVRDVMVTRPFIVEPDAPLYVVALEMANHRRGSALVVENGRAIGIFTTVDALRLLGELLQQEAKKAA